jgi:molecular chaperone HscB
LRDRVARVIYLLTLEGYKEAEKKAPADLLEEVFELNMHIEQLKAARKVGDVDEATEVRSELDTALTSLREKLAGIHEGLHALSGDWDSALDRSAAAAEKKALLDRMSELLSHRSYVGHLILSIEEEL